VSAAGSVLKRAVAAEETAPTALREVESVRIGQWDKGWFAYVLPVHCDGPSLYFRLIQPLSERDTDAPGRNPSSTPRRVTKLSADGKNRVELDPARSPKLAAANSLLTADVAVDEHGSVFLLVWATWYGATPQSDAYKQFVVSFDRKGEYRSVVEIDHEEFSAHQLQVFSSGAFALRGRRAGSAQTTVAILSPGGGLKDVVRWPGRPSADDSELPGAGPEYLVRGEDGRVYFTDFEAQDDFVTIYALRDTGDSEPVQKLPRRLSGGRSLQDLRWADRRFAATYFEADESRGEGQGRYWIAVADEGGEGSPRAIFGPAPSTPTCYQHSDAGDRFTFFKEQGNLVTMAPQ
jgi:hypothetical protein